MYMVKGLEGVLGSQRAWKVDKAELAHSDFPRILGPVLEYTVVETIRKIRNGLWF